MSFLKRYLVRDRDTNAASVAAAATLESSPATAAADAPAPLPTGSGLPPQPVAQARARVKFNPDISFDAPPSDAAPPVAPPSSAEAVVGKRIDPYTGYIIDASNTPDGARAHRRLSSQQMIERIHASKASASLAALAQSEEPQALKSGKLYEDPYAQFRKRRNRPA